MTALAKKLNYVFRKPALLTQALTHRSFQANHNERLEFLGDAILNFVVADFLYQHFEQATEGELTRMRAHLVNETVLAEIGQRLALGDDLRLGQGELKTGGKRRQSILADTIEAIIGAVYLDGGLLPAQTLIYKWFATYLQQADTFKKRKDAKSQLQEYLQGQRLPIPVYQLLCTKGDAHAPIFHVTCDCGDVKTTGEGNSRRSAEHQAAEKMLTVLIAPIRMTNLKNTVYSSVH